MSSNETLTGLCGKQKMSSISLASEGGVDIGFDFTEVLDSILSASEDSVAADFTEVLDSILSASEDGVALEFTDVLDIIYLEFGFKKKRKTNILRKN